MVLLLQAHRVPGSPHRLSDLGLPLCLRGAPMALLLRILCRGVEGRREVWRTQPGLACVPHVPCGRCEDVSDQTEALTSLCAHRPRCPLRGVPADTPRCQRHCRSRAVFRLETPHYILEPQFTGGADWVVTMRAPPPPPRGCADATGHLF